MLQFDKHYQYILFFPSLKDKMAIWFLFDFIYKAQLQLIIKQV